MDRIHKNGHERGKIGTNNSWPIGALVIIDGYVADGFG